MTKRFGLVMTSDLYNEFYRLFPDHGRRTAVLRRCVHVMVQKARATGHYAVNPDEIAEQIMKEAKED